MQPELFLESWITSVRDDKCTLVVRSPGAVYYLRWIPSELKSAPDLLSNYLTSFNILRNDYAVDDYNNDDDDDDDYDFARTRTEAEKLRRPFDEILSKLAPNPPSSPFTLHNWLYPDWFYFIATVDDDGCTIRPKREYKNPYLPPGEPRESTSFMSLNLDKWVPKWYSSREVQIVSSAAGPSKNPLLSTPSKVLVERNIVCHFKELTPGSWATFNELNTFRKISYALASGELPLELRICRLHGLVCDSNRVVGMLLVYIEPKITPAPSTLRNVALSASKEIRQRWYQELETIIRSLHKAGIQWGDAKPDNIMVDDTDNIWLIDFGGGYTPSWVSREKCGTIAGDLEGLEKIKHKLLRTKS